MAGIEKGMAQWLTIRVGRSTLSFSMTTASGEVVFEPYIVKRDRKSVV